MSRQTQEDRSSKLSSALQVSSGPRICNLQLRYSHHIISAKSYYRWICYYMLMTGKKKYHCIEEQTGLIRDGFFFILTQQNLVKKKKGGGGDHLSYTRKHNYK